MDWMQLPITKRCTFSFIHCWSFSFNLNILFVYLLVWFFLISFNHFSLLNRIHNIHSTKRWTYCKVHNLANLEVGRGGGTWNLSKNQFLFSIAIYEITTVENQSDKNLSLQIDHRQSPIKNFFLRKQAVLLISAGAERPRTLARLFLKHFL